MIVAWGVAYLMRVGRTCPNLDAALFFDPDEIRGAYLLSKKPQPSEPPSINEVLRMIAQLGGFLARKVTVGREPKRSGRDCNGSWTLPLHYSQCAKGMAELCITI